MWEIYSYQGADTLAVVFNAIAAIAGAGTYIGALALAATMGCLTAFLAYAIAPEKMQGWQWIASVTLVYSVLLVPRLTIGVVDKTGGSTVRVIDNVPFGLVVLASMTSSVGNVLTELFETAFQSIPGPASLPAELTYQKNGLMFGNRLIRQTTRVVFQDPAYRTDLINFIGNCTMYDLADGTVKPAAFATTDNVWQLMGTPNPARFTPMTNASGASEILPCPDAYHALDLVMPVQLTRIQGSLALQLNPTLPASVVGSVIAGQIEQTYIKNQIADAAASAADLIRQHAMINAINDASLIIGQRINDAPAMMLAVGRAQATAQTNAIWINSGKTAEQGLPVIRNVIEAVAYALFPIFILLLFLTSGKDTMAAIKGYAAVLIWLQLWPMLYATMNYLATHYAAKELAAAADVGGGLKALSLNTASAIYSNAISSEAVVGNLTIFIPFIAWSALKRMENLGTILAGSVNTLQSAVATSSSGTALGNTSFGNISMDQMTLSPVRNSPFFRSQQDNVSGHTYTENVNSGRTVMKAFASEGPVSRSSSAGSGTQHVLAAQQAVTAALTEAKAANSERSSAIANVISKSSGTVTGSGNTSSSGSSNSESLGTRGNELKQIAKRISDITGVSVDQVTKIALGGSAHVGLNFGGSSVLGTLFPLSGGMQGSINAETAHSAGIRTQDEKVLSALSSEDTARFKEFSDTVSRDKRAVESLISDTRTGKEFSKRIATAVSRAEHAEANLRDQLEFAERLMGTHSTGESISADTLKDPQNVREFEATVGAMRNGSAAMQRLYESIIGSRAIFPTPATAPGSNLPFSFDDVRARHQENLQSPKLTPAGTKLGKEKPSEPVPPTESKADATSVPPMPATRGKSRNAHAHRPHAEQGTHSIPEPGPSATPAERSDNHKIGAPTSRTPASSETRKDVERQAEKIKNEVAAREQGFDSKAGLQKGADGKPHAAEGRSLAGRVKENMENTRDPVSDTVRSFINKFNGKSDK